MAAAMVSPSPAWRGRSVVVARLFPSLPKKTAALPSRRLYFGPMWPEVPFILNRAAALLPEQKKSRKTFLISCQMVPPVGGQYSVLKVRVRLVDNEQPDKL